MTWGDQFASPLAALADGTLVVGATTGLMLLGEDGSLRAHPDPAAVGRSTDMVRSARGVFSLRRTRDGGSEVLAIEAQQVRVLWKDPNLLTSLAALAEQLVLVRVNGTTVEQVTISAADGVEFERQRAVVDLPADAAFARASAGVPYVLVLFRNGTLALGSLRMNTFSKVAQGEVSIAGPLSVASSTFLAIDGQLSQLVGDQAAPLPDDHNVACLAEHDGLAYACEREGIERVSGTTLGEPLFRFEWLTPPDLARVITDGDARFFCNMQWQDLRLDAQLSGITLDADATPDAAGAAGASSLAAAGSSAAGSPAAGGGAAGGPAGPGAGAGAPSNQPAQTGSCSCRMLPAAPMPRTAAAHTAGIAVVWALRRHRRRKHNDSSNLGVDNERVRVPIRRSSRGA
jgi:hypothetical protein